MNDSPEWYNKMENLVNGQDKKDLNVILERMEQAEKDRGQMHTDIKFIKENLFNPHEDYGKRPNRIVNSDRIRRNGVE